MKNNLRYFTIKDYENVHSFLNRIKYEIGYLDFSITSCSEVMGKGVQVLSLVSATDITDVIKIEVFEDQMNELRESFNTRILFPKKKIIRSINATGGMRDLH